MNPNECSICYEPLINNTIILPCNHTFHNQCMNLWTQTNTNTCPYCRHNLNPHQVPKILFDELIHSDGNIEDLTVDNFHYFYHLNKKIYNKESILYFINEIKKAHAFKSTLRICENYEIKAIGCANFSKESTFGKLIQIGQITPNGTFPCYFQTDKGTRVYFNQIHKFTLVE
uniref:RING-type domain-containing protein n=1 Tax=viral metagenome TaxID=1070528 RepID=A0A6C0HW70_9ZZZZ